jgi:hypothetical protein
MENETELVYSCPFCESFCWFNNQWELERHIFKSHIQLALSQLSLSCLRKVTKSQKRWHLSESETHNKSIGHKKRMVNNVS